MVRIVKRLMVGAAAALAVGVVCGGVARLLMRLMVVAAEEEGAFSVAGTVAIMVVFAVFALPGAMLAALTRRRGRSTLLVVGGVAMCIPTTGIAATDLAAAGLFGGFEVVYIGGAVIGVYLCCLAIPFVGLAAVDLLDRRRVEPPFVRGRTAPRAVGHPHEGRFNAA
ncbi:MAG TPA: hypothetical protein VFG72_02390 [Marmoricola sp.]|nr:hypothetical protein [Marmoricola sp.]